jgi:hypothetical protein
LMGPAAAGALFYLVGKLPERPIVMD